MVSQRLAAPRGYTAAPAPLPFLYLQFDVLLRVRTPGSDLKMMRGVIDAAFRTLYVINKAGSRPATRYTYVSTALLLTVDGLQVC